jgi:DNA topoisomerase-1
MHPAVLDTMSVDIQVDRYIYRASGSKIKFPGFMKLYVESSDDAVEDEERYLPALEKGMTPDLRRLDPQQHFTQPPPRYTEASLVKAMEENGIGRPSTYAPTLETIQKRGYVLLEERRFVPTELGRLVIELIDEFFTKILDVDFTANLEEQLDRIEEGKTDWIKVIDEFYRPFAEQLSVAEKEMKEVTIKDEVSDEVCEKCGKPMVYKLGRYGKFLACSGFPDCRNTKPIVKELGVNCPKCGGQIVERKSKRNRLFYGCSRYPECDFVSWDKPVLRPCPSCGHLMVEKKGKGKVVTKCTECQYEEEM